MNTRTATSLVILILLAVSGPAWGQVPGDPSEEADGAEERESLNTFYTFPFLTPTLYSSLRNPVAANKLNFVAPDEYSA